MAVIAASGTLISLVPAADIDSSIDGFRRAMDRFGDYIGNIGWPALAIGLVLSLGLQLCRAHAWANALRAAYPDTRVREGRVIAAFLVGAGMNGVLPARGGEALKIVLTKRSIEDSSYPAIIASFAVLFPFDWLMGLLVLAYAITQGLLPRLPRLPKLPAFEVSFWTSHPWAIAIVAAVLIALIAIAARRVDAFVDRLRQGVAILREPRRYAREVFSWQLAGWLLRFASFWAFLEAFRIGGSFQTVLLVMSVQAIAGALPFTPGGAGGQQALLVATLEGPTRAAVLAYSVGQQVAVTVWSIALAFGSLIFVFRARDWRSLLREGREARGDPEPEPDEP